MVMIPDRSDTPSEDELQQLHDSSLALGFQYERAADLNTARVFYRMAVRAKPDSAWAWYNYGDILLALKQNGEAVAPLMEAVRLAPGHALYRYDLGLAYARLGQHQKARRALASVVLEDPHLVRASSHLIPSAMVQLALTEGRLGSPLRGAGILQPALKPSIQVIYHLGRLSLQGDDPKTAIPLFEACVALQPEDEPSVHGLGTALLSAGRHAEALPHLRRAVRLDPACENAHYDLGVCFAALQKHRTARSCFKKALRLNPRHEGCHYGLACLDALENRPDAAFRNLEKSIAFGFGKPEYIRRDTDFRSLQKDRRWKPLLTGIRMKCGSAAVQDRRPGPVEPKSACFPEKGV